MFQSWAFALVSCVVELEKAETASTSKRFFSYPLVELVIAEMACVSRNIRTAVPAAYGIPVQRSISERDGSYPSEVEFEKA